MVLLVVLIGLYAAAILAHPVARRLGRDAGYALAAVFGVGAVVLVPSSVAAVQGNGPSFSIPWIPALGIEFSLTMDALTALFTGLVLGIGTVVMAYSARYLSAGGDHGRLFARLTFFAASMLGLVLAGDAVLLFVFWELTSVASFLLIGGSGHSDAARPAMRAFVVTGLGGLALLAAIVLLIVLTGSSDLTTVLADTRVVQESPMFAAIGLLLLAGAATKSALFPFHFWLPGAMVAPTPVSTYLHSATMVKAGIYLLLRTAPLFEGVGWWNVTVVLLGLGTSVMGAAIALRQYDLKRLLAYSTVSQLGFLAALAGLGTHKAILAACALLVAHALYKATLFMVVGIVDREAGSRDIRELSGLRRAMPLTALATGLAGLSMAGIPPLLGFVSKEEAFSAFLSAPGSRFLGPLAIVLAVTASALTFAYGFRIFEGAFGGPLVQRLYEPTRAFLLPPLVTSVTGLVLGIGVGRLLDPIARAVAFDTTGRAGPYHLALWHGFTPALMASIVTVSAGLVIVATRRPVSAFLERRRSGVRGADLFDRGYAGLLNLGGRVASTSDADAPAPYLLAVLLTVIVVSVGAWMGWGAELDLGSDGVGELGDWPVLLLLAPAVLVVVASRDRIAAVAALGLVGFALALLYAVIGAPDLVITQVLVETLTVALIVLVFRRLPRRFPRIGRVRGVGAALTAAAVGGGAMLATQALTGRRPPSVASDYYLSAAQPETGGANVVNTILVDFRALDTLGEIAVLALAALGAFGLVAALRKGRSS